MTNLNNARLPEKRQHRLHQYSVHDKPQQRLNATSNVLTDHQYCVHDKLQLRLNTTSNVRLWENVNTGYWSPILCVWQTSAPAKCSQQCFCKKTKQRLLTTFTVFMTNLSNVWTLAVTFLKEKKKKLNASYWSPSQSPWQTSTSSGQQCLLHDKLQQYLPRISSSWQILRLSSYHRYRLRDKSQHCLLVINIVSMANLNNVYWLAVLTPWQTSATSTCNIASTTNFSTV